MVERADTRPYTDFEATIIIDQGPDCGGCSVIIDLSPVRQVYEVELEHIKKAYLPEMSSCMPSLEPELI